MKSLLTILLLTPTLLLAQTQHFSFIANTGDSYSIVVTDATLNNTALTDGDEIGVFTPGGLCVGASVWSGNPPLAITAWADNSQTGDIDGYIAGEAMSFRIWQQSSDTEYDATATYAQGDGTFENGIFAQLSLTAGSDIEPAGIVVENTNSTGPGSLADAIMQANNNAGADVITFAVPETDPGYHDVAGTWTIALTQALPAILDDSLLVDGFSQASFIQEDTNPDGPEIVLDGSQITNSNFGFFITSAGNRIRRLALNGFDAGIYMTGENAQFNSVTGCFIGTDATGSQEAPNNSAIQIYSANNIIGGADISQRNILSGNNVFGILLSGELANNNRIIGNFIGTDASGSNALSNQSAGIMVQGMPSGNEIGGRAVGEGNLISGNGQDGIRISGKSHIISGNLIGTDATGSGAIGNAWDGISIWGGGDHIIGGMEAGAGNTISGNRGGILLTSASDNNHIIGNFIGTNSNGSPDIGNTGSGIWITGKANTNIIGPDNLIAFNQYTGISVSSDSTFFNTITQNSIWSNSETPIETLDGGNKDIPPPIINSVGNGMVAGTGPANAAIEIFSDMEDEGAIYDGTTSTNANGNFQWSGTISGPNVTATATDTEGNTSAFSDPFEIVTSAEYTKSNPPNAFELQQNYPNPFNPQTKIRYSLSQPGNTTLSVFNLLGQEVRILVWQFQTAGTYDVVWDGKNNDGRPVADGIYLYKLNVDGMQTATRKMVMIR